MRSEVKCRAKQERITIQVRDDMFRNKSSTYTNGKLSAESSLWMEYLSQSQTSQSKLNQDGNDIVHIEDRGWEIENRRCELGDWGWDSWDAGMRDVGWVMGDGRWERGDGRWEMGEGRGK